MTSFYCQNPLQKLGKWIEIVDSITYRVVYAKSIDGNKINLEYPLFEDNIYTNIIEFKVEDDGEWKIFLNDSTIINTIVLRGSRNGRCTITS